MRRVIGAAALAAITMTLPSWAAPPKGSTSKACIAAHEEAQKLRNDKKPHAAHDKFVQCASDHCPVVVRKECAEQLASTEKDAPTVAIEAHDEKGNDTSDVKVTIDGNAVTSKLTGVALDVEPGEHVFVFERADGKKIEQKVLVVEGEKNRKIVASWAPVAPPKTETPPPPPPKEKSISPIVWVAGGVGVVALGSFAFFALHGKGNEHDLADSCSPHCVDSDVSPVHRDYLIADVSLGIGLVAAAVAVWFAVAPPNEPKPAAAPWMPRIRVKQ